MPRFEELVEFHDHPRFPKCLRDLVTDALQELWQFGDSYAPVLPLLYPRLKRSASSEVLDLCSGGGGPWPSLLRRLARSYGMTARVRLTDKYPNLEAFQQVARLGGGQIFAEQTPVDALSVPISLRGFRTIFSSFHHFDRDDAIQLLRDAVQAGQGIGVFEIPRRRLLTLLVLSATPFMVMLLTLRIRPLRLSRLFWTYLVPVVPLVIWLDGLISCLRAYSVEELASMVDIVSQEPARSEYHWQVGVEYGGLLPVTYLIGNPS